MNLNRPCESVVARRFSPYISSVTRTRERGLPGGPWTERLHHRFIATSPALTASRSLWDKSGVDVAHGAGDGPRVLGRRTAKQAGNEVAAAREEVVPGLSRLSRELEGKQDGKGDDDKGNANRNPSTRHVSGPPAEPTRIRKACVGIGMIYGEEGQRSKGIRRWGEKARRHRGLRLGPRVVSESRALTISAVVVFLAGAVAAAREFRKGE